jgi:hypothetical protein
MIAESVSFFPAFAAFAMALSRLLDDFFDSFETVPALGDSSARDLNMIYNWFIKN